MVIPANYPMIIRQYKDFSESFSKLPYDITDVDFKSDIKDNNDILIASFTIVKDIPNKTFYLTLSDTETGAIPEGTNYKYDVEQTDGTGYSITIVEGAIKVQKSVTIPIPAP